MRAPRAKARGPVWDRPLRRSSDRSLHFCRGGTLGRPVPWAGMPVGRAFWTRRALRRRPACTGRRRSCILRPPVRRSGPGFFPAAHPLSAPFMQKRQRHKFFSIFGEIPHPQGLSTLSTEFSTMCYVKCNQAAFCIICRIRPVKRFSCGKSTKIHFLQGPGPPSGGGPVFHRERSPSCPSKPIPSPPSPPPPGLGPSAF